MICFGLTCCFVLCGLVWFVLFGHLGFLSGFGLDFAGVFVVFDLCVSCTDCFVVLILSFDLVVYCCYGLG